MLAGRSLVLNAISVTRTGRTIDEHSREDRITKAAGRCAALASEH
jgi:hypothetical protein